MVRFTETLAREVVGRIDVNAITPGVLNTACATTCSTAGPELAGAEYGPTRDRGETSFEPATALAVYLASAASDGVSGRLIAALWDDWRTLHEQDLDADVYTLRRVMSDYTAIFLDEAAELARGLPVDTIDAIVDGLAAVRDGGGRLFILGVGGGAGHASHAVNDFRKICAPGELHAHRQRSELTARINDDGWESAYAAYLKGSRINGQGRGPDLQRRRRLARAQRLHQPRRRARPGA